jgi:hypothetical protein
MTVINMISLGETGIAVADEQASIGGRTENSYQKLFPLNNTTIFGMAGTADFAKEVYHNTMGRVQPDPNSLGMSELRQTVGGAMLEVKDSMRYFRLKGALGIHYNNFLTGRLDDGTQLSDSILRKAGEYLDQFEELTQSGFVLGGIDNDNRFSIYKLSSQGLTMRSSSPYASIGSGSDQSQNILSRFASGLRRDERDDTEPVDGLYTIVEATNASRINQGVGGTMTIYKISPEGITSVDEDESRLVGEIVEADSLGYLDQSYTDQILNGLVFENMRFDDAYDAFRNLADDWDELDLILRGYRR